MKHPIIIEGNAFDFEAASEAASQAVDNDGNVCWGAAMFADPGVMTCPSCGLYLWNEGDVVRCPDCGHEWETEEAKHRKRISRLHGQKPRSPRR